VADPFGVTVARRFRRIPLEVEAALFEGDNAADLCDWITDRSRQVPLVNDGSIWVSGAEGLVQVPPGWWLVYGPDGEWSALRRDRFPLLFEEV
jgi:hypothetical protein